MIINHNLPGMNAIRNMNSNSATASKSMQKLSSGLRINSAADDAAGLAISEKMKGQIRGLDQASSNAQDGISMIQTSEGALNETQSILQRMRELSVQSANDTNTADDRTAVQTEMNQLTSEINRIGNTTEFNTQKVLNGGNQISAGATASAKTLIGGQSIGNANAAGANQVTGTDAVFGKSIGAGAAVLSSDVTGLTGAALKVTVGGTDYTLSNNDIIALKDKTTTEAAAYIADKAVNGTTKLSSVATVSFDASNKLVVTDKTALTGAGGNVTMTVTAGTAGSGNKTAADLLAVGTATDTAGTTAVKATADLTFSGVSAEGTSVSIAGKKVSFYDSTSGNFADATAAKTALASDYVVDTHGITTAAGMASAVVAAINNEPISGYTVQVDGTTTQKINIAATTAKASGLSTTDLANKTNVTSATAATGSVTFTTVPTQDSKITVGASKIGFYDSSTNKYADAAAAKTALGTDFVIDTNGKTTVDNIKDAVISLTPQMTDVVLSDGGVGKVSITAASTGAAGNTIKLDAPKPGTTGFSANLQIGANTAQSLTVGISDMRAQALNVSGNTGSATVTAKNGAVASYVSTSSVTDGTSNTNSEFSLDVSTNKKATAAISVLDDAISSVSSQRSQLGAYQNRLEHTINNLGTSSENLTSAQSRIADVDMAKEMATFSKNNILSQAAQAMLAQANTQPQQVLQLLR